METNLVTEGNVTTPHGFIAGAAYAGIKTYAQNKMDVGILLSEKECISAGIYTTNKFVSPSVELTSNNVKNGKVKGVF